MTLIIEIKVLPASGKQGFVIDKSGSLKCYLKNSAEKGKANLELIQLIAKLIKVTQNDIEIIKGELDRKKRIKINKNITYDQFLDMVGLDKQLKIK